MNKSTTQKQPKVWMLNAFTLVNIILVSYSQAKGVDHLYRNRRALLEKRWHQNF